MKREELINALNRHDNIDSAAASLGICRSWMHRLILRFRIHRRWV